MQKVIREGRYEKGAAKLVKEVLQPDDIVLELGAGIGVVATICANIVGSANVVAYDANLDLKPIALDVFRLNGVSPSYRTGLVDSASGPRTFHKRENFWASSTNEARADDAQDIVLEATPLGEAVSEHRPTCLIVDIEGGEDGLIDNTDLPGVRLIIIEVHDDLLGEEGVRRLYGRMNELGFVPTRNNGRDICLERDPYHSLLHDRVA
jgi:FkbM family methyltransferase